MTKEDLNNLLLEIKSLVKQSKNITVKSINSVQLATYFFIGARIVEYEQAGEDRAEYGKELLIKLSNNLTNEFGRGYSRANLEYIRKFYLCYVDKLKLNNVLTDKRLLDKTLISQSLIGKSDNSLYLQELSNKLSRKLHLSWTHYILLMSLKNQNERSFYEIEATTQNWSVRELKRQISSCLYERLALSKDKAAIKKLSLEGLQINKPEDVLKNPYVLEFLGLEEQHNFSESDLETAIINKLEKFLLELGKGFLFEARQKRFTFEEDHFFVDLVFYNRLLKCYTLIDLKIGKISHQDLGQMQMYVNYYDRFVKTAGENSTVGIIICKKNNEALVEITLPKDANIHAAEYKLYLPSKDELKQQLEIAEKEWKDKNEN